MPTYKLIYFNVRGRAEAIRLVLAASGTKYEDVRIEFEQWPALKPTTTFGVLPMLEVNGKKLAESNAIGRFLAKEHGLSGKNHWEQGQVDSIVQVIYQILEKVVPAFREKDETKKAALMAEYAEKILPGILDNVEKFLTANGGGDGWLVGKNMTWADLELYGSTENPRVQFEEVFKGYPKITALLDRVAKHPKIADYLKNRPATDN